VKCTQQQSFLFLLRCLLFPLLFTTPRVATRRTDMAEQKYAFWIETRDGQEVRWSGLTKVQAVTMYNRTDNRQPLNVKAYGWEETE
jgi:hypothetical protein